MNCEKLVRMKVADLKALLRQTDRGAKGVTKMTKPQLIGKLSGGGRPTLARPIFDKRKSGGGEMARPKIARPTLARPKFDKRKSGGGEMARPKMARPKTPTPRPKTPRNVPKTPTGLKAGVRMMLNNKRALKDATFFSAYTRPRGDDVDIENASDKVKGGMETMEENEINEIITNIGRFIKGYHFNYNARKVALERIALLGWELKNRPTLYHYPRTIARMRKLGYI